MKLFVTLYKVEENLRLYKVEENLILYKVEEKTKCYKEEYFSCFEEAFSVFFKQLY